MRLCASQACNALSTLPNIGNAVNTASATVKKGTSAIVVVNVRLLAVSPSRSSRKRSPSVSAVDFHGKLGRSVSSWRRSIGRYDAIGTLQPMDTTEQAPVTRASETVTSTRWLAVGSLLGLIVLGLAWELWLA